ncbi:MAG: hypothetical protein ABTQ31_11885 [Rhizobiaceae bacterium]
MGVGLSRRAAGAAVLLALLTGGATARADNEPPQALYPEILVATDDSYSSDMDLAAFRLKGRETAEAKIRTERGWLDDPRPMLDLMAEAVEVLVAQGKRSYDQDFVSLGLHAPETAMEMVGRLAYPREGGDAMVKRRYAMRAIGRMLADPVVGSTPWLDGRICTASYGKVSWPDWMALSKRLPYGETEWVIAVETEFDKDDLWQAGDRQWPKRFQLVPVSPEQKAAAGWLGVLSPEDGRFFFRTGFDDGPSYFAPYLNDHVCFEKREGGWRIAAVAVRLDR